MANTFRKFPAINDQLLIIEISKILFPKNSEDADPVLEDGCVQNIVDKKTTTQIGIRFANGNFFPTSDMFLEWWFQRLIHFCEYDFQGVERIEPLITDAERHWMIESENFNIWRADALRLRGTEKSLVQYMAKRLIELFSNEVDVSIIEALMQ